MATRCSCSCGLWNSQGYPALSSMLAPVCPPGAACRSRITYKRSARLQRINRSSSRETFRVVALEKAVMQRNSNGVEAGAMQECDVLARDVVVAVLLPECGRPFRSKQLQHQRARTSHSCIAPASTPFEFLCI